MADQFGNEVSRTLDTLTKQFSNVIWQQSKPPLDSELNLVGQIGWDSLSEVIRNYTHSGFLSDPLESKKDYHTSSTYSNYFEMGKNNDLTAVVNGWIIPIKGTNIDSESNAIKLDAPPSSDARTDIVFLEVWRSILASSPSTDNKPSADKVWKYGNVLYGRNDNPNDEMIDGSVGFETTKRVQVQHRIRVVSNVDVGEFTSGLGSPTVLAQGTQNSPVANYTFTNQSSNGDKGLWRSGNGDAQSISDLGTVDGYVYAIPICAVFRRNTNAYLAISAGVPNHNGSTNRTPSSVNSSDARILTTPSLTGSITNSFTGNVNITNLIGSGLDDALLVGDVQVILGNGTNEEIVTINTIDTNNGTVNISQRGRGDTQAKSHVSGTTIRMYNTRTDGKYADEIHSEDVLDLKHSVIIGEYDYQRLLESSVNEVLNNELRSTFKLSGNGSDSKGVVIEEISSIWSPQGLNARNHTSLMDGPDGIRQVWSDASVYQNKIDLYMDLTNVPIDNDGISTSTLNAQVSNEWTTAPDFNPNGFLYTDKKLRYGSCIFLNIGGSNAVSGARRGIKSTIQNNLVRFVHPKEFKDKIKGDIDPFKLRFFDGVGSYLSSAKKSLSALNHRTNAYLAPTKENNYEDNFMLLGEILQTTTGISTVNANLATGVLQSANVTENLQTRKIYAINLNVAMTTNLFDTTKLHNHTSMYDLLTANGTDLSGDSSELYLVLYGDPDINNGYKNNGAFKIIGAGNGVTPFSTQIVSDMANVSGNTWVFCEKIGNSDDFVDTGAVNLTAEFRTEKLDSRDESLCLVLTGSTTPITSQKFVLSCGLLWPSSQGAMARTVDQIHTIAIRNSNSNYLRNSFYELDSTPNDFSITNSEIMLPVENHVGLWSKLPYHGFDVENASDFDEIFFNQKTLRESEAFYDNGSKTVLLRPYQYQNMSLSNTGFITNYDSVGGVDETGDAIIANYINANPVDAGLLFTAGRTSVYAIPYESLPSLGRQDIPYHTNTGVNDRFLSGINHLFVDNADNTTDVFNIIGGENNNGSSGVFPLIFTTGGANVYGEYVNNMVAGQEGYVARKTTISTLTEITVNGIELPPFLGIARVYGVYEKTDFDANAVGFRGAFESDRITPIQNAPVNLMRTDAKEFTLFIKKDGASDDLGDSGCHTYILTENAIDITRISNYVQGQSFTDFDYVVECVVFGFAKGFITENNLVLTRRFNGNGDGLVDVGATVAPSTTMAVNGHLANVGMVFPSAIKYGEEVYIGSKRTVYQGDPYHTVGDTSPQYSDSSVRDGQVPPSESYKLGINFFRSQSDVRLANKRNLQVLASMDFYTTLGSGNIGGKLYPSTFTDVGFAHYSNDTSEQGVAHKVAVVNTEPYPQNKLGVFTETLKEPSTRDAVTLIIKNSHHDDLSGTTDGYQLKISLYDRSKNDTKEYLYDVSNVDNVTNSVNDLVTSINAHYPTTVTRYNDYTLIQIRGFIFGNTENRFSAEIEWVNGNDRKSGIDQIVSLRDGLIYFLDPIFTHDNSSRRSKVFFKGGNSIAVNGGKGNIPYSLVGMTSRLPLGILVNDFDFLCEDPLNNQISYLKSYGSQNTPYSYNEIPTNDLGLPYTISLGNSGEFVQMSDGSILEYTSYSSATPTGTKKYRMYRGGGSLFGVSGVNAGSPLTWGVDSISAQLNPVLKGGVLACRAMLVKNFDETAFEGNDVSVRSYGDEIQLVIATNAIYGERNKDLVMGGTISPSGYGEGFASSDRYRLTGKPLLKTSSDDTIYDNITPAKLTVKISN